MSVQALIKESTSGERYKLQDKLVNLSGQYPGYTMTQLSWIAAGGQVDAAGFCQPAVAFNMALEFFNAKRRGCEIARYAEEEEGRRPNARLIYGNAVRNPYDFGGAGVYPLGGALKQVVTPAVVVSPQVCGMPDSLRDLAAGL